jgi:hypothetical protein
MPSDCTAPSRTGELGMLSGAAPDIMKALIYWFIGESVQNGVCCCTSEGAASLKLAGLGISAQIMYVTKMVTTRSEQKRLRRLE